MARLFLVTPAGPGTRNGNRHTALRWATLLRASGHRVRVALAWNGEPCDALIALHARRSAESISRLAASGKPVGVAITGTDLYKDLPGSAEARRSLELADRIVVLQEAAPAKLEPRLRRKTRVVFQSAAPRARRAPPAGRFRVCVIGHLRGEKDPLRAVMALSRVADPRIEVIQIGSALDAALGAEAEAWMAREPRYRWLGALPHGRALAWMARSHALVVSSLMEGGANVIAEAARIGTPVLASRVSGNVGMLGRRYPGYYPVRNETALAALLARTASDGKFLGSLQRALRERRHLFAPAAERRALAVVLDEALEPSCSSTLARTALLDQSSSP
jgi:putative glycosyltransferase (TIGR04348 family)